MSDAGSERVLSTDMSRQRYVSLSDEISLALFFAKQSISVLTTAAEEEACASIAIAVAALRALTTDGTSESSKFPSPSCPLSFAPKE